MPIEHRAACIRFFDLVFLKISPNKRHRGKATASSNQLQRYHVIDFELYAAKVCHGSLSVASSFYGCCCFFRILVISVLF